MMELVGIQCPPVLLWLGKRFFSKFIPHPFGDGVIFIILACRCVTVEGAEWGLENCSTSLEKKVWGKRQLSSLASNFFLQSHAF
jgi:hypothetical protein